MPSLLYPYIPTSRISLLLHGDSDTFQRAQLTWTLLPQAFKDSPRFFSQAFATDLVAIDLQPSTLIQYVNDLLLCSPTHTSAMLNMAILLNFLSDKVYRVSPTKAQIA